MYSCFMQIPQATVRSLSLKPINLTDADVEDDDSAEIAHEMEVAEPDDGGKGVGMDSSGAGMSFGGMSTRKQSSAAASSRLASDYFRKKSENDGDDERSGLWSRFVGLFGRRGRASGPAGKRVLQSSNLSSIFLVRTQTTPSSKATEWRTIPLPT